MGKSVIIMPMKTSYYTLSDRESEKKYIKAAGEVIRRGGLVAFPTETVYGLGGNAEDPQASAKIYQAKGRPSDNPLIVHIAEFSQLEEIASEVPPAAKKLAEAFWPGPLTMIVKKNDRIPLETTGGLNTVAVRMPSNPVAQALIRESGCMIAAPSANTSGRPSPTRAEHVREDLDGRIDVILDGGPVGIGLESTIVDLTEEVPVILRPGYVNPDMLSRVLGEVHMDPGISEKESKTPPKAPGMRYRHYAPRAPLTIVDGPEDGVISFINEAAARAAAEGKSTGVIATDETCGRYEATVVLTIGQRSDEVSIARHLFDVLRQFDKTDVDEIYSESFATPQLGQAIMNRLLKAAGHRVMKIQEKGMKKIKRIVFAVGSGTSRAPMAAGILKSMPQAAGIEVEARGMLVQFPEPLNQKAEAVMISNGIIWENFSSSQLTEEDFSEGTLVFAMEASGRQKILDTYSNATEENTKVLSTFVGDELEIMDPYGGTLQTYGLCFEVLKKSMEKLVEHLC